MLEKSIPLPSIASEGECMSILYSSVESLDYCSSILSFVSSLRFVSRKTIYGPCAARVVRADNGLMLTLPI